VAAPARRVGLHNYVRASELIIQWVEFHPFSSLLVGWNDGWPRNTSNSQRFFFERSSRDSA